MDLGIISDPPFDANRKSMIELIQKEIEKHNIEPHELYPELLYTPQSRKNS